MYKQNKSDGFAMIEVLIAIVVLAIGLLAGSRMQILGMNFTQGATTRTYATMTANDMLDRMRINPAGVETYNGFNSDTSTIPADQLCSATVVCTAIQRADQDLRDWARSFTTSTLLPPNAIGTITHDATASMTTVTISWDETIRGEDASTESITIGAVL